MEELRRTGRSFRSLVEADIEILPLMNLFIVLIPMLLLSAVFIEVTVVDMALPGAASAEDVPEEPALELSVLITPEAYVIDGHGIERRLVKRDPLDAAHEELLAEITEIAGSNPTETSVRILSTPRTPYGEIISVMDISREAGFTNAGLAGAPDAEGSSD